MLQQPKIRESQLPSLPQQVNTLGPYILLLKKLYRL